MKNIITVNGEEFEIVPLKLHAGTLGLKPVVPIEPVKKTEKKGHRITLFEIGKEPIHVSNALYLNLNTAFKLSEAISALVEYVTTDNVSIERVTAATMVAYLSYQESQ